MEKSATYIQSVSSYVSLKERTFSVKKLYVPVVSTLSF